MRALIYTAGLGTRLRPLTYETPKPMVEVASKPVLEHLVEKLNDFGIDEIIMNLHHLPKAIYEHFGTKLLYFYEPELLGEVGTLSALSEWFMGDEVLLLMGDTLTNLNLYQMYDFHTKHHADITAFVDDKGVCGGTWMLDSSFHWELCKNATKIQDMPSLKYCPKNTWWIDIGTPTELERAREKYDEHK